MIWSVRYLLRDLTDGFAGASSPVLSRMSPLGGGCSAMTVTLEGAGAGGSVAGAVVSSDDGIKHHHTSASEHERSAHDRPLVAPVANLERLTELHKGVV